VGQAFLVRAFWHVLALSAAALVLFATLVPTHAETLRLADVAPLPVPSDLAAIRSQPAKGPILVAPAPGQQKLTEALLANYVARQQKLRSVNVNAEAGGELNTDLLMSYIARTGMPGNSAVTAIASFAPATPQSQPPLNPSALAAYVESGYQPLDERIEHANAERDCLAQAIYHEARGESEAGQLAVANVIVNRARSGRFPSTLCGVIYQNADKGRYRCQFTFACDGRNEVVGERRAWTRSAALAQEVYAEFATGDSVGAVPGSALYYHTTAVRPSWANTYNAVAKIGSHVFYSPN
jgi:spore germination cell wall hydrolase CwlJ-like protein